MFNAEGAVRKGEWGFNVMLRNQGKGQFEAKQFSWGLVNDFNLFSFALIDFDRDGDLDIIENGAEGPPQVYENNVSQSRKSIGFKLHFPEGNKVGLGAKILIRDTQGRTQVREIKAGGGYLSFDTPEAYFGLDQSEAIESLTVIASYGKRWDINQRLNAEHLYEVHLK